MTLVEYNNLVGQVRYHFSSLTQTLLYRKRLSSGYDLGPIEDQITILGYYLDILEDYFLPVKLIGTTAAGDTDITLYSSITPSDYDRYIGHVVTCSGINDTNTLCVTRFGANNIYLSGELNTAGSNIEITISKSCLSLNQMRCIVSDINRILGTNLCKELYWTEYDLNAASADIDTDVLLVGSSATTLIGSNIYAALNTESSTSNDFNVLYDFTLEFPYVAYQSTIVDLSQILDQDGDDVLASGTFSQTLLNVSFPGVASTVQYKVYTTSYKTTISSHTYQFKF